jgi:DNA-binding NtrC family response regulator
MERFREVITEQRSGHNGNNQNPAAQEALISLFGHFPTIAEIEEYMFAEAMRLSKGNQGLAANLLGLSRQTLNRHLQKK